MKHTMKRNIYYARDDYLYHQWNKNSKNTSIVTTSKTIQTSKSKNTNNHPNNTLDTLFILDFILWVILINKKSAAINMLIINFIIWNQPIAIVHYQMPNQPPFPLLPYHHHHSRLDPSILFFDWCVQQTDQSSCICLSIVVYIYYY